MIEIPKTAQSIEYMGQCFHSNQPFCYKNRNKLSNHITKLSRFLNHELCDILNTVQIIQNRGFLSMETIEKCKIVNSILSKLLAVQNISIPCSKVTLNSWDKFPSKNSWVWKHLRQSRQKVRRLLSVSLPLMLRLLFAPFAHNKCRVQC